MSRENDKFFVVSEKQHLQMLALPLLLSQALISVPAKIAVLMVQVGSILCSMERVQSIGHVPFMTKQ